MGVCESQLTATTRLAVFGVKESWRNPVAPGSAMVARSIFNSMITRFLAALLLAFALSAAAQAQETKSPKPSAIEEPFGEEVARPERKALFRHSKTSWQDAWINLVATFKTARAEAERLKLKVSGPSLVMYRSTSDEGFEFDA